MRKRLGVLAIVAGAVLIAVMAVADGRRQAQIDTAAEAVADDPAMREAADAWAAENEKRF